jgi:hypothetical protein
MQSNDRSKKRLRDIYLSLWIPLGDSDRALGLWYMPHQ